LFRLALTLYCHNHCLLLLYTYTRDSTYNRGKFSINEFVATPPSAALLQDNTSEKRTLLHHLTEATKIMLPYPKVDQTPNQLNKIYRYDLLRCLHKRHQYDKRLLLCQTIDRRFLNLKHLLAMSLLFPS